MASTRVACEEEGAGDGGKSDGDEGGGRATATRAMVTEGEQQSTSDGINKGGRWLARERRRGDHTTEIRVVGNKEGEGDDEKDDVGDEGGMQQRGRWRRLKEQWRQG
jgi:hypothetical protein